MPRLAAASLLTLAALVAPGHAQRFPENPDLLGTCLLLAPVDGTIALGGDLRSWATTIPASVTVVNTARSTLMVSKPTQWASSPAGAPATSFSQSASLTGVNVGALLGFGDGLSAPLSALGTSVASVSLGAVAPTPFRSGTYSAQVTVTCAVD